MKQEMGFPREAQKMEEKVFDLSSFQRSGVSIDEKILVKPKRPWWRRRPIQLGITGLVIALVAAKVISGMVGSAPLAFQYQQVTQSSLILSVSATGPVQGKIYNASFNVNTGKVSEVDVKISDKVTTGQTLAKLDPQIYQDNLDQAQAYLKQMKIYGNSDSIATAQSRVKTAQDLLKATTLLAPHAGIVTAINGGVGSVVSAGGNSFIQLSDDAAPQIQAYVNEADIGNVSIGQEVQFTVSTYGDRTFYGKVSNIAAQGVNTASVVTYPVTVDVDMSKVTDATLRNGMTANVSIIAAKDQNVLLLPVSAINIPQTAITQGLVTKDQVDATLGLAKQMQAALANQTKKPLYPGCVLTREENKWVLKPVLLSRTDGVSYEVVSGLLAGDSVVSNIQQSASIPASTSKTFA